MKVSIIVPVYNSYKYLDKCIDSLVNQTTKEEYEIILVNDCSSDNSLEKLYEWKDKYPQKIAVIDSKVNLRQGGARNLGMQLSKGEYIQFVDSDDYIRYDALSMLLNAENERDFENTHKSLYDGGGAYDVIYSDRYIEDCGSGDFNEVEQPISFDFPRININDRKLMLMSDALGIWQALYRKEMLCKNAIKFKENSYYEDALFTFQIAFSAESIKVVHKSFYYYNITNNEATTQKRDDPRQWEGVQIAFDMRDYLLEHDLERIFSYEIEGRFVLRYLQLSIGTAMKFTRPQYNKIKEAFHVVKKEFPNYKKNIYYKKYISKNRKVLYFLAKHFPRLAVFLLKRKYNKK